MYDGLGRFEQGGGVSQMIPFWKEKVLRCSSSYPKFSYWVVLRIFLLIRRIASGGLEAMPIYYFRRKAGVAPYRRPAPIQRTVIEINAIAIYAMPPSTKVNFIAAKIEDS
jgi:hypothetical protein